MLDTPAQIRAAAVCGFEDIEDFAVGPVPDRVHTKLEVVLACEPRRFLQFLDRCRGKPDRIVVFVRFEQPCPVRSQRAVGDALDRAHGEPAAGGADRAVDGHLLGQFLVGFPEHDPQTDVEFALVVHRAKAVHVVERRTGVVQGGHAFLEAFRVGQLDLAASVTLDFFLVASVHRLAVRAQGERIGRFA